MLDLAEEMLPVNIPAWNKVAEEYNKKFPKDERTGVSLKRKYYALLKIRMPTGDPRCPPEVRQAKRIKRLIFKASDGAEGDTDTDDSDDDEEEVENEESRVGQELNLVGVGGGCNWDSSIWAENQNRVVPGIPNII